MIPKLASKSNIFDGEEWTKGEVIADGPF